MRCWLAVKVAAHLWQPVHPKPNTVQGNSRRKLVMEVIFFWKDGVMVEIYTSLFHLMVLCSPHVWPTCGVRWTLCVLVCKWIRSEQVDLAHTQVTLYTAHLCWGAAAFLPLSGRTEADSEDAAWCDGVRDVHSTKSCWPGSKEHHKLTLYPHMMKCLRKNI